jgi:thiamine phosphate synthase YjbQ (UPF0047 family)
MYLHEIKFDSTVQTYIKDITKVINKVIKKTKIKQGFAIVASKHTTLGIILTELSERNLLSDFVEHALESIHEDKRSSHVSKDYKHPICNYKHRCQDNPYCDEIDNDYDSGAHIRNLTFAHPSVTVAIRDGKLDLGKYQQVGIFEFDGRDGKGVNPIRKRTVQIWIFPSDALKIV